uniref:ATP synthase F0 subunit 8 n=1 Tax=Gammarus duebeni TaxID=178002 RepID=H9M5R2_9CRUS|nr:ATP synthase F0 subunit 8 [Gammarus duebeni]AER12191.1 ATP synthase F0 subunit 8 [Gammarus duebeni]
MPQMAPVLWLPLFTIMLYLIMWNKSIVYFSNTPLFMALANKKVLIKPSNWTW